MKNTVPFFLSALPSIIALLATTTASAAPSASADEQNALLQRYAGDVSERCKADFSASIDVESFAAPIKAAKAEKVQGLAAHCRVPMRAVTEWCASGYAKNVTKQATALVCRYARGPVKATVSDGVLTVTTPWSDNGAEWANAVKQETGKVFRDGDFSIGQAALIKNDKGRIRDAAADMKRRCGGHDVKWTVDWASFGPEIDKRIGNDEGRAIWQECYEPLRALERRCNNDQADLVQQQVDSVVCRFDKDKEPDVSLDGKTLRFQTNLRVKGVEEWVGHRVGDLIRDGDFSARQTDFIKDENAGFQRVFTDYVNEVCATEISWEIDWVSFKDEIDKRLEKVEVTSIYDACGVPMNRLMDVCRQEHKNKLKVKKKIKSFACTNAGKKKSKLKLRKGKLSYSVDFSAKDPYGAVDRFLVKKRILKKRPPPKKLSATELSNIRRILGEGVGPAQQCRRNCSKTCRHAANKSKCKSRCRAGCG